MKLRWWTLFFLALFVADCATSIAPQGGPEDKYPPRVAGVFPAPGAVNVPMELNVHLQFDEWIAASVSRSAVTISPPLEKGSSSKSMGMNCLYVQRRGSTKIRLIR